MMRKPWWDVDSADVNEPNIREEYDAAKAGDEMIGEARCPQSLRSRCAAKYDAEYARFQS